MNSWPGIPAVWGTASTSMSLDGQRGGKEQGADESRRKDLHRFSLKVPSEAIRALVACGTNIIRLILLQTP